MKSTLGGYQVVFSLVQGVRGWLAIHWRAELFNHDAGDHDGYLSRPVAVAYLTDYPRPVGPVLDYLTVFDQHRGDRRTIRHLIQACKERFPGLTLTERLPKLGQEN